jgi:hypothetical protein
MEIEITACTAPAAIVPALPTNESLAADRKTPPRTVATARVAPMPARRTSVKRFDRPSVGRAAPYASRMLPTRIAARSVCR